MNVWKVVCATLVIFLAGIITGATLVRFAQVGPRPGRIQRPIVDNRGQPNQSPTANPLNQNQNPPTQYRPDQPPPLVGAQAPGLLSREFIQVLERQLRLTLEQHQQIDKIMAEGQERVRELRARIDPELRKELQRTREHIRSVLTPEQREQFEQMMKRSQRRAERVDPPGQPDNRFREPRESRNPQGSPPLPPQDQ